ncbi:MAG: VOC family protein [Thermoplasmata archaeon]|nr:VOC family protein [Thermoplasmata archaeon]
MLETANVIAFLATARPEESRRFYQETLGLISLGEDPRTLMFDCNGTTLRIQKLKAVAPGPHTALGWQVSDLVREVHTLSASGVKFVRYTGLDQDRDAIWTAPGGTLVAWFKDPDGNVLSLTEPSDVV